MAWWGALLLGGCAAQVKAEAHAGGSVNEPDERRWEVPQKGEAAPAPSSAQPPPQALAAAPSQSGATTFLGVMHDLSPAPGAGAAPTCTCLGVTYGPPSDPKFAWQVGAPQVGPDTLAVAITGDVECRAPQKKGDGPPSISGIGRQGDDVVIFVEAARGGRPVVRGALVQRPGPKGAIVVKPRGHVRFGTPLGGGSGACRIAVTSG
jgi:hypothetical protein